MSTDIHERILQIIDNEYNGVKTDFAKKNDLKKGTVFSMFKKGTNPSFELIASVLNNHREINPYWLILGEGQIADTMPTEKVQNCQQKLLEAKKEIEYLKKINNLLENQK